MIKLFSPALPILLFIQIAWAQSPPVRAKPTCAILTFDARASVPPGEAALLSDRFASEFEDIGKFQVIARSKMKEILDEQAFQYSDACSAAECAIEAGKLLSARCMVYGSIGQIGSLYTINSYLLDVETGAHLRKATTDLACSKEEALTVLMQSNARELLGLKNAPQSARLEPPPKPEPLAPVYAVPRPPARKTAPAIPRKTRAVYVSPRLGLSTSSGFAGAEIQVMNLAASAGLWPDGFAWGARLYFTQDTSSWFVGVCGFSAEEDEYSKTTFIGGIAGYRWRSPDGWEFSLGAGVGQSKEEDPVITETLTDPTLDLAIGYAF